MNRFPLLISSAVIFSCAARPAPGGQVGKWEPAVAAVSKAMRAHYLFPEVAEYSVEMLRRKLVRGGYHQARPEDFALALTRDLQALTEDRHLLVRFDPGFRAPPPSADDPSARRQAARENYGVSKVEVLPGNVGLLDLRFFGPAADTAPTLAAAMKLLANTEALILDLRHNRGGDPETMATLCSYFFPAGRSVHLSDTYYRTKNVLRELWTRTALPAPRYARPVYVLTSAQTFSGGEEVGYVLQTRKRATVVGETTAGEANAGGAVPLGGGFVALVPTGEVIDPLTRTSWERVGVRPDLAAAAPQALQVAHAAALRVLLKGDRG